jgi:hypothetical protein
MKITWGAADNSMAGPAKIGESRTKNGVFLRPLPPK